MPLNSGTTFAGYRIVRLLGSGGMGDVYLAQHPRLPRRDALKVLRAEVSADPDYRERFIREADLASKLRHPHIVSVHDRGEHDGQLWISMDYIDGTDAARMTRDRYPAGMPPDEAVEILTAVAGALDYAHQQGLLHRDVKPANILLSQPDPDGERQVFLADFGIARELADPGGLTATNITVGTVAYAAPEQLMGQELDGRADQYALAATAFHLLTGAPPYQHSNPVAIIGQHLNADIPKLSDHRPDLADFDHAMSTALAKNPDQRFGSCRDFAKALREHVPAAPVGEHTTQAAAPEVDAPRHPPISVRAVVLALIPVALVGTVIAVVLLFTGPGNPPPGPPNKPDSRATAPPATAPPTSQPIPVVAAPPLEGTYRLDFDYSKGTINGQPVAHPRDNISLWFGFRSACTSAGCVATGTLLDNKNLQAPSSDAVNYVLDWINGRWQSRDRTYQSRCYIAGDAALEVSVAGQRVGGFVKQTAKLLGRHYGGQIAQIDGVLCHGTLLIRNGTPTANRHAESTGMCFVDSPFLLPYEARLGAQVDVVVVLGPHEQGLQPRGDFFAGHQRTSPRGSGCGSCRGSGQPGSHTPRFVAARSLAHRPVVHVAFLGGVVPARPCAAVGRLGFASLAKTIPARFSGVCPPTSRCAG
jgi:serine/threonine-protein kinase